MKTVLQKILLLLALMMPFGTVVYAVEGSGDQVSEIMDKFAYSKTTSQQIVTNEERQKPVNEERMKLIDVQLQYVIVTASMYVFSLIITIILMKMTPDHKAKDLITIIGLVSVIFGTILLVLVISDTEQMTAPIGILGAIAGYLFGASQKKEASGG